MSTKPRQWFDVDPSAADDWHRPVEKLRCDAVALILIMSKTSWTQAVQSTLLLLFWMGWTALILVGGIEVSQGYARVMLMAYGGVSIVLGIIFGRQWGFRIAEIANAATVFTPGPSGNPRDYHSPHELEDETEDYPDDD